MFLYIYLYIQCVRLKLDSLFLKTKKGNLAKNKFIKKQKRSINIKAIKNSLKEENSLK